MSFVDRVWSLGRVARDLGNSATELAMQQPNVRRRVDEVKTAVRTARARRLQHLCRMVPRGAILRTIANARPS